MDHDKPDLRRHSYLPSIHRQLPQAMDAEEGVIGSFLLAPKEVGGLLVLAGASSQWFHLPALGTIYGVLMEHWEANKPLDVIQLMQTLKDRGILDQVGGPSFVTQLYTRLPTAANAKYYTEILKEKHVLREIIRICTEFASRSYEEQGEVWELLQSLEIDVLGILRERSTTSTTQAREAVMQAMVAIEAAYERKGSITGLSTGLTDLDKLTDGLHAGEMIVIAARPSQGKTALAMNIAEHVVLELKKPVGVFSLEMSSQQLMQRMICSRARVNLSRVRDGYLSERDFPALTVAASKLADAPLYLDDASDMTVQELRARARRLKHQHDVALIIVDYLQLLKSTSKKSADNRQLEVSEVSGGIKAMAKELNVPVIVLAQINRKFDERAVSGRPRLSDLRESGSIEQDADVVGFLVRPETYAENAEERAELEGRAQLIIAKQRSGPIGDVDLTFLKEFTRFETRARSYDNDEADAAPTLL